MANLIVTFTTYAGGAPVADGNRARTEQITIAGASDPGVLKATLDERIVELYAGADCWIAIGITPVAAAGGVGSRFLKSGSEREYWVEQDEKLAVIQA